MAFLFFTNCLLLFTCLVYWKKNTALCQKGKKVVGILGFLFINVTDLVCFSMCGGCKKKKKRKGSAQTVIVHTCDHLLAFIKCFHTNLITGRLKYCAFPSYFFIYLHECRREKEEKVEQPGSACLTAAPRALSVYIPRGKHATHAPRSPIGVTHNRPHPRMGLVRKLRRSFDKNIEFFRG